MRISGEQLLRVSEFAPAVDEIGEGDYSLSSLASLARSNSITTSINQPGTGNQMKPPSHFDIQRVAEIVDTLPDVREDVVASLRARIESGTYTVSGEQVAEMMVRRFFADLVR